MSEEILQYDKFDIGNIIDNKYPITICTGGRNIGKTFSTKRWFFDRAITKEKPFITLVREVALIDGVANSFFDNIRAKGYLTEYQFYTYEVTTFMKMLCCKTEDKEYNVSLITALKKSDSIKNISLENTCGIYMDEMIPETGIYLRNEPNRLLSIYNTAMRDNDPNDYPVVLLGNICGRSCPYFGQWDIEAPEPGETKIFKDLIKFVNLKDGVYSKGDVADVITKLSPSYSNIMNNETMEVIKIGKTENGTPLCDLVVGNRCIKYEYDNGFLYFSLTEKTPKAIIAMDIYGNKPLENITFCRSIVMSIRRALTIDRIRYADYKTYSVVVEFINLYR